MSAAEPDGLVEHVARAICLVTCVREDCELEHRCQATHLYSTMDQARAAIEAMREPQVIEAACRAAADKRTGYICWEGVSVHRAADVVDAVLRAALDPNKPAKAVGELL